MIELADLIQQQPLDTNAIRAAAEPDRYRYIYGARIEHQRVAAIYALCDALDAVRDIAQRQNIEAAQTRAEIATLRVARERKSSRTRNYNVAILRIDPVYSRGQVVSWVSRRSALTVKAASLREAQLKAYRRAVRGCEGRCVRLGSVILDGAYIVPVAGWERDDE